MTEDADRDDFRVIESSEVITPAAKSEQAELSKPDFFDAPPNSVTFKIGNFCQIKWHSESSAPLFCFISILGLLVFSAFVALISAFNSKLPWTNDLFKFVGQAILTLVGAVVGSSVSGGNSVRVRRPPKN